MTEVRDGSRLEIDDPRYCKECGTELDYTSLPRVDNGVLLVWMNDEWKWVELERCHNCWWEEEKKALRDICEQRYGGELPEGLAR